jgi:hypothetical protein
MAEGVTMDREQYAEVYQAVNNIENRLANMQYSARFGRAYAAALLCLLALILWRVW